MYDQVTLHLELCMSLGIKREEMYLMLWDLGLSNNLKLLGSITQTTHAHTHTHKLPTQRPRGVCHKEVWQRLGWPNLADGSLLLCCSRCGLSKASSRNRTFPDRGPFLISMWGWLPQCSPQVYPAHSLYLNNLNLPRLIPYIEICQTLGP